MGGTVDERGWVLLVRVGANKWFIKIKLTVSINVN